MAQSKTQVLINHIRLRHENREPPFVLVLGSGAMLAPDSRGNESIVETVLRQYATVDFTALDRTERLQAFYEVMDASTRDERYMIFKSFYSQRALPRGYSSLAQLVAEGYFDLLFTTTFDPHVEDALFDVGMRSGDFKIMINGEDEEEQIITALEFHTPRIKLVKLHGDLNARILAFTPEEVFEFSNDIENLLRSYVNRDVIIVGHDSRDEDLNRCVERRGGALWYVNPNSPATGDPIFRAMRARRMTDYVISGEEGNLDNFFITLADELLHAPTFEDEAAARGGAKVSAVLRVDVEGEATEFDLPKEEGITWQLGRSDSNEVVIKNRMVSRHHARVELRDGAYFIVDEDSTNGTWHDGERISEHKLANNDEIQLGLGKVHLTFIDKSAGESITEKHDITLLQRPQDLLTQSHPLPRPEMRKSYTGETPAIASRGAKSAAEFAHSQSEPRRVVALSVTYLGLERVEQLFSHDEMLNTAGLVAMMRGEIIQEHGGKIDDVVRDNVIALFGVVETVESSAADPLRQALSAALELRAGLARINADLQQRLRRQHKKDDILALTYIVSSEALLTPYIGIAAGEMPVRELGKGKYEYHDREGITALSLGLCDVADGEQILVERDVYERARRDFEFIELPPRKVTGKEAQQKVAVYELLRPHAEDKPAIGLYGIGSPLVGRAEEFTLLKQRVGELLGGKGQVVIIRGEAGVGKSRLVAELRDWLGHRGDDTEYMTGAKVGGVPTARRSLWIEGNVVDEQHEEGFSPLDKVVCDILGFDPNIPNAIDELTALLSVMFPARYEEMVPYIAYLLDIKLPPLTAVKVALLDAEGVQRQIFMSVRDILARQAGETPIVLVFDDLQWVDSRVVAFLNYLMETIETAPLLILGIFVPAPELACLRFQTKARLDYPELLTEMELLPLENDESKAMLMNLVGATALPEEVMIPIIERTGGNPFYIGEAINALIDTGKLVKENGRWLLTAAPAELHIFDSIEDVIRARVNQLDPAVREILQRAAIIGKSFSYSLLAQLMEEDICSALDNLQYRELIREVAGQFTPSADKWDDDQAERVFVFRRALVHRVVYEMIDAAERREYHRVIAGKIIEHYRFVLDRYYEQLARHYEGAKLYAKSLEYSLLAAQQAREEYSLTTAQRFYEQARDAFKKLEPQTSDADRVSIEEGLAYISLLQGDTEQAISRYTRVLWQLKRLPELEMGNQMAVQAYVGLARACERKGQFETGLIWMQKGLDTLGEQPESVESIKLRLIGSLIQFRISDYAQAEAWAQTAMELAQDLDAPRELARSYLLLGRIYRYQNDYARAIEVLEHSLALNRDMGDLQGMYEAHDHLAHVYFTSGDFREMEEHLRAARETAEKLGTRHELALSSRNLGIAYFYQGDFLRATDMYLTALREWEKLQMPLFAAMARNNMGEALARQKQCVHARRYLQEAREQFETLKARDRYSEVYYNLATVYLESDDEELRDIDEAYDLAQKSLEAATALHQRVEEAKALRLQGRVYTHLKKWDEANAALQNSLVILQEIKSHYEEGVTMHQLARLRARQQHTAEAIWLGEQAMMIFKDAGAEWDWREAQAFLVRLSSGLEVP